MTQINKLRTAIFMGRNEEALNLLSHPEIRHYINDPVMGGTCLHVACKQGQVGIVRELLAKGADVEKLNKFGETPLHVAAESGKLHCVKLLLQHGADIKRTGKHGKTAYDKAKFRHHDDVLIYLANYKETSQLPVPGLPPTLAYPQTSGSYPGQHYPAQGYPTPPVGYPAAPPQGYSAPQPQGYPAPPQGYAAPQPHGYPAPPQGYSAPQPQGYPALQQGYSAPRPLSNAPAPVSGYYPQTQATYPGYPTTS